MHLERYENIAKKIQDVPSKQIFFVVGSPKSGTTWLQKLLDSHPDILCSGEGHFHRFFNDFGQVIKKYNTGKEEVSKFVYEGKPYYSPVDNEQFDFLMTSFICSMLGQRYTAEGIQFLGDKTPLHVEFMETLRIIFPTAKFIHIIRDGRDVAVSLTRHSDRMLNRTPTNAGNDLFYQCIKESAQRWNNAIQAALRFKQKFPQNYHEVRYWELKQKPVEAMEGILNFLGASYTQEIIQQMYDAASFKKLSGGRKAGEEDNSSFFRKGIIGDWKNHFDEKSLEIFNQHAAPSLVATGYDVVTHEPAA
jgi:hypothetical protein